MNAAQSIISVRNLSLRLVYETSRNIYHAAWLNSTMWTLYFRLLMFFYLSKTAELESDKTNEFDSKTCSRSFPAGLSLWLRHGKLIQATAFVSARVRLPLECVNCRGVQEACIYRNTWLHTQEISQEQFTTFRPGLSVFCLFLFFSRYFMLSFGPVYQRLPVAVI